MDTDLVIRAQRGDKDAYALVAAEIADRFLAVARRILRDSGPRRGRDAAGAARGLAGPSAAPRPGSLRILVVPRPRQRLLCRGSQGASLVAQPSNPAGRCDLGGSQPRVGRRSRPAGARLPPPDHRPARGGGPVPLPRQAARRDREDPRDPRRDGPLTTSPRDARDARGARRRRAPNRRGRLRDERQPRHLARRSVVDPGGRARLGGPRPPGRSLAPGLDPTAPLLVAGAEVPKREHPDQGSPRAWRPSWSSRSSATTCCPIAAGPGARQTPIPTIVPSPSTRPTQASTVPADTYTAMPFFGPEGFVMCGPADADPDCVEDPRDETITFTYTIPEGWVDARPVGGAAWIDDNAPPDGAAVQITRGRCACTATPACRTTPRMLTSP